MRELLRSGMVGFAVLAAVTGVSESSAADSACSALQAKLSALPTATNPAQIQAHERAILRQEAAIARAQTDLRRAGCKGPFASGRVQCRPLLETAERMADNLDNLRRERAAMGDVRVHGQRLKLKAAIERGNCSAAAKETVARATNPPPPAAEPAKAAGSKPKPRKFRTGHSYRTMCVRLCDGYYFPISYSVPASRFPQDAKACQARCPGADTALYAHRVPGEESADMVSATTGLPYRELENAFAHRTQSREKVQGCGCQVANPQSGPSGYSVIAGENRQTPLGARDSESSIVSLGRTPDPHPRQTAAIAGSKESVVEENRPVRVVGPKFLPDPEEAIDQQVRAPIRYR